MSDLEIALGNGEDVLLQAFHWNVVKTRGTGTQDGKGETWYEMLARRAEDIANMGITIVYLPPPWRDDSHWENAGQHGGGEGYFWQDFDLNSRYGSREQLQLLVSRLKALGLHCIVDLVPNHRNHRLMTRDVWPWPGPHWAKQGGDDGASFLSGDFDLNLRHPEVQARIREAMVELMSLGIVGWRWDFVWGYDAADVAQWIRETPEKEYFSMGEYWQVDGSKQEDPLVRRFGSDERARILGWARATGSAAFDIPLKRQINTANAGQLKLGVHASGSAEDRKLAVTYVDNHDTGTSPYSSANGWGQKHWPCPDHFKHRAYAHILSMPGTPSIYWPDAFDWGLGEDITRLIAARRRAGITSASNWVDLSGQFGGFAAIVQDASGRPALAVSIDSAYRGPGAGWGVAHERLGEYTVWVRD
jgi:alpha-amylase